jgi:CubicO group peptidase (beta-lactamase class C family)
MLSSSNRAILLFVLPLLTMTLGTLSDRSSHAAEKVSLAEAKQRFAKVVQEELARGILPGVSVAWVVDGEIVYEDGFGFADWDAQKPATPQTVYRAGSISKLFNAVAAMQLVERGLLDLDAPIQKALPEFQIVVPFADAIPLTARQMLCHRSGMIRESYRRLFRSERTKRERNGSQRCALCPGKFAEHKDPLFQRGPHGGRSRRRSANRRSLSRLSRKEHS